MEKQNAPVSKKNIIFMSTVIFAVLFAVITVRFVYGEIADNRPPEIKEIERLYHSEISVIQNRDSAYEMAFAKSGGDPGEYEHMDNSVDLDILFSSEDILSIKISSEAEDASPYGREKYYNIHRGTGKHLTLPDILGYDYKKKIESALIPQVESDTEVYDGIDVLPMINEDRMFYLADNGNTVVIVFDTGEITPDSMGIRKYSIPVDR